MTTLRIQLCGHRPAIAHFAGNYTRIASDRILSLPRKVRAISTMASASSDLWALDFDGVACDSCGESSLSAWKVRKAIISRTADFVFFFSVHHSFINTANFDTLQAAAALWPDRFSAADAVAHKDQIIEDMRAVRPVVETG